MKISVNFSRGNALSKLIKSLGSDEDIDKHWAKEFSINNNISLGLKDCKNYVQM